MRASFGRALAVVCAALGCGGSSGNAPKAATAVKHTLTIFVSGSKPGPAGDWQSRTVPTADLLRIQVRRPGLGALEGFLFGLPLGMIGGTTLGYFVGSSGCHGSNECGAPTAVATFFGFVGGTLLGMFGGTALGSYAGDTSTVEFDPPRP